MGISASEKTIEIFLALTKMFVPDVNQLGLAYRDSSWYLHNLLKWRTMLKFMQVDWITRYQFEDNYNITNN